MSLRHRALPLLLWVLLLAGCMPEQPQPPLPAGNSTGEREDSTAAALLGDLRTVDPCTLTDVASLRKFGQAERASTVSMDFCLLQVKPDENSLVQLTAGELISSGPDTGGNPVVSRGPLRIVQDAPLPGHCTRQISFADGIALQIDADLLVGDPAKAGLCELAESEAEVAVDAVVRHRVGHRDFPENSLALVDPCTLLEPAFIQQVPGLEQAQAQASPARHQCMWGEQVADSPRVQLKNTAGETPRLLHGAAVEESIAGRRTVLSIVGGDPRVPLCSAETAHLPFGDVPGQVEVAQLIVAIPGESGTDACAYARGLATQTWPRLPPPSP